MRLTACAAVMIVTACAPTAQLPTVGAGERAEEQRKQYELAYEDIKHDQQKSFRVYNRVVQANADRCQETRYTSAFMMADPSTYSGPQQPAGVKVFGLSFQYPTVVASTNPGVQVGDHVKSINGRAVTKTADGLAVLGPLAQSAVTVKLVLIRDGAEIQLEVPRYRQCASGLLNHPSGLVNAFADGKNIIITTGMIRFTESDEELALVIGHELAHNEERHVDKQRANRMAGAVVGVAISILTGIDLTGDAATAGAMAFSQEFEREADYVGLYFAARAGYDITRAPNLWRRMAVNHPTAIAHGATHPDTASRFIALEKAVAEIEAKRRAGSDLSPERLVRQ